jgi:hypothetical protein
MSSRFHPEVARKPDDRRQSESYTHSYLFGELTNVVNFGGGNLATSGGYDVFVAKLDPAGNHLWGKRFGDASDQRAAAMTVDATGGVIVAANVKGTVNFGGVNLTSAGNTDVAVARFDGAGNHIWSRIFGDASAQTVSAIAADPLGNVVVAGSFLGAMDFGNATGSITAVAGGQTDIFLASLAAADGKAQWRKQFGDGAAQNVNSVAVDVNGNIALVGRYGGTTVFGPYTLTASGATDLFVAKLDSAGAAACVKNVVASDSDFFTAVHFDSASNMVASGSFYAPITFGGLMFANGPNSSYSDVFLAKLSVNCSHVWSKSFGFFTSSEYALGSVVLPDDRIALVLNPGGTIDMGGGLLPFGGVMDIALAVMDPAGNHQWSKDVGDAMAQDFPILGVTGGDLIVAIQNASAIDFGAGPITANANGRTVAVLGP